MAATMRIPPCQRPVPKTAFGYCVRCEDAKAEPVYVLEVGEQLCAPCYFEEKLATSHRGGN